MSRAYGWDADDVTIIDTEAAVIRRMADHILDGGSIRPLGKLLSDEGVKTATGRDWEPITIKRTLTNPRIVGKKKAKTGELVKADCAPILDNDTFAKLTDILNNPDRQRFAPKQNRTHLLSGGLARCGKCGAKMFPASGAKGRGIYACMTQTGCGGITIVASFLEDDVTERVLARMADAPVRRDLSRAIAAMDSVTADKELAALDSRLTDLGTDYARGLITRETLHSATAEIKARAEDVKRKRQDSDVLVDLPDISIEAVVAWWEDASKRRRRDVVAVFLDHVTVKPLPRERRGFAGLDPNRLEYFWRNS